MPPHHKRGPWSQQEDQYLLHLVNTQGAHNWVRISQIIGTRSPKQCRERYHQNLKPTLNHDPISAEEGALIERLVNEMGKRWAEIARRLQGRSDNAVKNWWNGGMNRRKRLDVRRATSAPYHAEEYRSRNEHVQLPQRGHEHVPRYPEFESRYHDPTERQHYPPGPRHPPQISSIRNPRFGHRPEEAPTPSPSAMSFVSRYESDCPPSLVSDGASSYTPSPRYPFTDSSSVELPPLGARRAERRSSVPVLHLVTNQFVADEEVQHPRFRHEEPKRSSPAPQPDVMQGPEPLRYHRMRDDAPPPRGQLPLPEFRTLPAPHRLAEVRPNTQSPTRDPMRDTRMSLSTMLS